MIAPQHARQKERLEELYRLEILDSEAESEFDELTALVARICEMPVCLISLVDKDRQWFKAKCGLDRDETGLEQSICSHVIIEEDLVEIPDLTKDARTVDNPLVNGAEDHFRFYAGVPLVGVGGLPIGTLCVMDYRPRYLSPVQTDTLRVFARMVMRQIEFRKALADAEVMRAEIDHRVKNSLQTVLSVARLYRSRIASPEAISALEAVSRRIEAIASLHAELYQTSQTDRVQAQGYLERVVALLQASAPANVSIVANVSRAEINSRVAANLGVIVSEFVANAIKHAFPDGRSGIIRIDLNQPVFGDDLNLICRDDGIGFETRDTADAVESLGLRLMQAAADQISGELTMNGHAGQGSELKVTVAPGLAPLERVFKT